MNFNIMEALLMFTSVYLLAGIIFYLFFTLKGMAKLDASTQGTSVWFKVIIAPGVVAFWVFLLVKLIKTKA